MTRYSGMTIKLEGCVVAFKIADGEEERKESDVDAERLWGDLYEPLRARGVVNSAQQASCRVIFKGAIEDAESRDYSTVDEVALFIQKKLNENFHMVGVVPNASRFDSPIAKLGDKKNIKNLKNGKVDVKGAYKTPYTIEGETDFLFSEVRSDGLVKAKAQLKMMSSLQEKGLKVLEASEFFMTDWGAQGFVSVRVLDSVSVSILKGVKLNVIGLPAISSGVFYTAVVKNGVYNNPVKLATCLGHLKSLKGFASSDDCLSFFNDLQCLVSPNGDLTFHDPSLITLIEGRYAETLRKERLKLEILIDRLSARLLNLQGSATGTKKK